MPENKSETLAMMGLDFRIGSAFLRIAAVLLAVCLLSMITGLTTFAIPMTAVTTMMAATNLLGQIEAAKLTQMFGALPVSRRDVMCGHYLYLLAMIALSALPWLMMALLHAIVPRLGIPAADLMGGLGLIAVTAVITAFTFPAMIKWGAQKGSLVIMAVVFIGIGLFAALGDRMSIRWSGALPSGWALLVGLAFATLALMWLSYRVSLRVYERQDH